MGPAGRRGSPDRRSRSPVRKDRKSSPERKSSIRSYSSPSREKIPQHHNRSPRNRRSRSPQRERNRLPRGEAQRKAASRSPSPRSKRLRRALVESGEEEREVSREERRRNRDRGEDNRPHSNDRRSFKSRSISPEEPRRRSKRRSKSPSWASRSMDRDEVARTRGHEEHRESEDSIAKMQAAEEALVEKQKQKPSFELSGKLAEETNRVRGVTLLFTEPADARKPDVRWRLYVFKGGEALNEPLYVHRQSCYLFGRERRVADVPTDHPSCSKQHAVLQFRLIETERADGMMAKAIRPYLMDLGSTNGTFINDERIEPQRYYELRERDVIKFGNSSREYVFLHENSVK
ncbi:SMAD/FHA domain-containing protein [Wolffia australiana]